MRTYFRPYSGNKPYIFVSYAHKDSDSVLNIVDRLREKNYLLWYDEGIPAGSDWPKNIADHVKNCDTMLCFVSKNFTDSDNCKSELSESTKLGKKILLYYLNNSPERLSKEWSTLLSGGIVLKDLELPDYLIGAENDYDPPKIKIKINGWFAALIAAILVLAFGIYFAIRLAPAAQIALANNSEATAKVEIIEDVDLSQYGDLLDKNAEFNDSITENAVRKVLNLTNRNENVPNDRLLEIKKLNVCGNITVEDPSGIAYDAQENCTFNGSSIAKGSIKNLSTYSMMLYLNELTLANQEIESIDDLATLGQLTYLNISGNPLDDITATSSMTALHVLHIEHTNVKDLSPLKNLKSLETVTVSAEMLPLENINGLNVILVK